MAMLKLKYMICHDTQEWPRDEVYLKADGNKVLDKGGVAPGNTLTINRDIVMTGSSDTLKLFEDDWWPSQDEHLGTHTVFTSEAGLGERTAIFNRHGANYELYYEVLA